MLPAGLLGDRYGRKKVMTGRHGVFSCYEAFIRIVDSMFNQHAGRESL